MDLKEDLTKKVHGLPMWGWIAVAGVGLAVAWKLYKGSGNATPAATDSSSDTPSAADTSQDTLDGSGLPWAGGAPSGGTFDNSAVDSAQDQAAADAAASNAAQNAALAAQEAQDRAAYQSNLVNLEATIKQQAADFSTQLAALHNSNANIVAETQPHPTAQVVALPGGGSVVQGSTPASTPQGGTTAGGSTPTYLPPATIATAAKQSTKAVVGKKGNSGVHAE